jgi:hypothetical protein
MLLRSQKDNLTKVAIVSAKRNSNRAMDSTVTLLLAPGPEQARTLGSPYNVPVERRLCSDLELAARLQHAKDYPALVGEFFSMCDVAFEHWKTTTPSAGFKHLYLPDSMTQQVKVVAIRQTFTHSAEYEILYKPLVVEESQLISYNRQNSVLADLLDPEDVVWAKSMEGVYTCFIEAVEEAMSCVGLDECTLTNLRGTAHCY